MKKITDKRTGSMFNALSEDVYENQIEDDLLRIEILRTSEIEETWTLTISHLEDDRRLEEEVCIMIGENNVIFPESGYVFSVENELPYNNPDNEDAYVPENIVDDKLITEDIRSRYDEIINYEEDIRVMELNQLKEDLMIKHPGVKESHIIFLMKEVFGDMMPEEKE